MPRCNNARTRLESQLWRRNAARLLLGLLPRYEVDKPRGAGKRTRRILRPCMAAAKRTGTQHAIDGLRRLLLVQQLQQRVRHRGRTPEPHRHIQNQRHQDHSRRCHQPPCNHRRLVRLPNRNLQRSNVHHDIERRCQERRRRKGIDRSTERGRAAQRLHRLGRRLGRHARPRPQQCERTDHGEGIPADAERQIRLCRLPLRHGKGLRRQVHRTLQQCLTTRVLCRRILGRQHKQSEGVD